jgi:hypothetical protein
MGEIVVGIPLLMLKDGQGVTLVVGERTFQGTLKFENLTPADASAPASRWFIKLNTVAPDGPDEIQIHPQEITV